MSFGGKHVCDSLRHDVREGVAHQAERSVIFFGEDSDLRAVREFAQQVGQLTADRSAQGGFGEAGADGFGDVLSGGVLGQV